MNLRKGCSLKSNLSLYVLRKLGAGAGFEKKVSILSSSLVIVILSMLLTFSLSFIYSMESGIKDILVYLGSGDILSPVDMKGDHVISSDAVESTTGVIFSSRSSYPVMLKGVAFDSYFSPERLGLLSLPKGMDEGLVISRDASEALSVSSGDRVSLLIWDSGKGRVRPALMEVSGIFDTGYHQFDKGLCYVPSSILDERVQYEIITENHAIPDLNALDAYSSRMIYSEIYSNLDLSLRLLLFVFVLISILSSTYASSIASFYVSSDKRDIGLLMSLGLGSGSVLILYLKITFSEIILAIFLGFILGLLLSYSTPFILSFLVAHGFDALEMYLVRFEVEIPLLPILGVYALLAFFSFLVLRFSLSSLTKRSILENIGSF